MATKAKMKKRIRVTLTLPDGTRRYYDGETKKEAEAKRDKDKLKIAGGWDVSDSTTFAELSEAWLDCYKKKDLHIRSVETTEAILRRYVLPYLGILKVKDIKPIHIDRLLAQYSTLSYSTQKKILGVASQVFEKAIENDMIPKSPTRGKKPTAKAAEEETPLTVDQCNALLEATRGTRVYPFVAVLMYCGLRKGEALGLMWSDIDFDTGYLTVNRSIVYTLENRKGEINSDLKTEHAHRTIPLTADLLSILAAEKAKSTSLYVFSGRDNSYMSEASFRRMWDLISYRTIGGPNKSDRVKQTLDFTVHPHQLRHTCCTAWIYSGMNPKEVQYLMGHADAEITMNVYSHYIEEQQLKDTAEKLRNTNRGLRLA